MAFEPLASRAGHIHVCGHRGHCIGAPENTLAAIVEAARLGATVCEVDVVLTRDDAVVLLHDDILDRTTSGRGCVSEVSLDEIRQLDAGLWFAPNWAGTGVPTLAEAIASARELGMGLLIEIKERRRVDLLIDKLLDVLDAEAAVDDVLVISFDHPSLIEVRRRNPDVRTELITHARHVDPVALAKAAGAASVAIEAGMFHPEDARALSAAGIATRVTVPRPEWIKVRRAYGFDPLALVNRGLADGLIDVLAGDDVRAVRELVEAAG